MYYLIEIALLAPWIALVLASFRRAVAIALVVAPLPLLLAGVLGDGNLHLSRFLLGSHFQVDDVNRPLLVLAGVGWSLAGWFSSGMIEHARRRFALFWLLALAGQGIALLAADFAAFYAGYASMTLAAFGLVVHTRSAEAWRAGRVYLVLSLAAEMAILAGLLMLAAVLGNARFQDIPVDAFATFGALPWWLMFAGFALKLGVFPLHVWLPLAHPVAPVPASAVLSGLLVKAGLLGMLRLLPPLTLPAVEWLVALGLFTTAFGALVGLTQPRLKTVLAYSTISQMGLLLAGFAAVQSGLGQSLALAAVGLFALHHGLNKIALFLAAGHAIRSPIARALFLLPALSLAGLPPTSGALAKDALKHSFSASQLDGWLLAVSLSSALTTVLLLHAYRIGRTQSGRRERVHPAWVAAVVAGIAVPWVWAPIAFEPGMAWSGLWPLLLGVLLHQAGTHLLRGWRALQLPEGDLLLPLEHVLPRVVEPLRRLEASWRQVQPVMSDVLPGAAMVTRIERDLGKVSVVGLALLLGLLALWGLLGAR